MSVAPRYFYFRHRVGEMLQRQVRLLAFETHKTADSFSLNAIAFHRESETNVLKNLKNARLYRTIYLNSCLRVRPFFIFL